MRGLKSSGMFAACGFVLSFIAGLFSHTSILSVLLKALIFACVFGLLGFAVDFVFQKFLSDGTGGDFQGDFTPDGSAPAAAAPVLGQHVDITIQDEELKKSESDNHFVVGENRQMLNDSDVRSGQSVSHSESGASSSGFVPLRNYETVTNVSGTEAQSPVIKADSVDSGAGKTAAVNPVSAPPVSVFSSADSGDLDTLPDMEGFSFSEDNSSSSKNDDEVPSSGGDSEFVSTSSSRKTEEPPEVKDAALMAKAISSVLSDENSL